MGWSLPILLLLLPASVWGIFDFVPRSYDGTGNNLNFTLWGSANVTQIRSMVDADYADGVSITPGGDRPSARAVTTDVFRSSTAVGTEQSVLFASWGLLMAMDMVYNIDNRTEPFDIPCDDGGGFDDVWCPLGDASADISFFRSEASVGSRVGSDASLVRNPINYATAYLDLDLLYGRTGDQALSLRTLDGGKMNISESGRPHLNVDGTWKMADQRPAKYPVTFALHSLLLLEHNRCCVEVAPNLGFTGDEDIYQACRGWTIARYQHVVQHDFTIRLLETSVVVGLDDDNQYVDTTSASETTASSLETGDSDGSSSNRRLTREIPRGQERSGPGGALEEYRNQRHGNHNSRDTFGASTGDVGTQEQQQQPLHSQVRGEDIKHQTGLGHTGTNLHQESEGSTRGHGSPLWDDDDRYGARNRRHWYRQLRQIELAERGPGSGTRRWGWGSTRKLLTADHYDYTINPGADVFALTVGAIAFEAAIPPFMRIVTENYEPADEDMIELAEACKDVGGLIDRNGLAAILRGAVLEPSLRIDSHFPAALSTTSPLFKLPVDAVQRGRDHGVPAYNNAREAYGLSQAETVFDITDDSTVAGLLDAAYNGDISALDAVTGALAEGSDSGTRGILGDLLKEAWLEQMFRTFIGDRHYHHHSRPVEDVENTTLHDLISLNLDITDLPLAVFTTPEITVCVADCTTTESNAVALADEYILGWEVRSAEVIAFTISSKHIDDQGMLGVGFGGTEMVKAQDFVICEVKDGPTAECIDRQPIKRRSVPPEDDVNPQLEVESVAIEGDWTSVTFLRYSSELDSQDYDVLEDINADRFTDIIYAYREGKGLGQHPNTNRGASSVHFGTATTTEVCEDDMDFYLLHGCLMLFSWMILAPLGIYFARYHKGDEILGQAWHQRHAEVMIVASETVLPLSITAIFSTSGDHSSEHAIWGIYLIVAVATQVLSGWLRVKALEGRYCNFSLLNQMNKHLHIWAGRFAYLAGVVQCYRGVELVSSADRLLFSTLDIDIEFASFGLVRTYFFPLWFGFLVVAFAFYETRKQMRRFSRKGAASVLGLMDVVNNDFVSEDGEEGVSRVLARKKRLRMYTWDEFNYKVLNGQCWVVVDGTIVDVSTFASRHPGGQRLIVNAIGTDVTHEVIGRVDSSVGKALSVPFTPHVHTEVALSKMTDMAVGYIDEDDRVNESVKVVSSGKNTMDATRRKVGGGLFKANAAIAPSAATGMIGGALKQAGGERLFRKYPVASSYPSRQGVPDVWGGVDQCIGSQVAATRAMASSSVKRENRKAFYVCPLLLWHRMDTGADRAVYMFVFSCPGEAQNLARAISGVCHVEMRIPRRGGESLVQRSYNAYAVRVLDASPGTAAAISARHTLNGVPKIVVPARDMEEGEGSDGDLCVEMRIRLYDDGAMSKLLKRLATESDNPAVQLRGPYFVANVTPPPVRRHVLMLAAGTGINPMVQIIRDYQRYTSEGSDEDEVLPQLTLLWQSVTKEDMYCKQELEALKDNGPVRLETVYLVSGDLQRMYPGDHTVSDLTITRSSTSRWSPQQSRGGLEATDRPELAGRHSSLMTSLANRRVFQRTAPWTRDDRPRMTPLSTSDIKFSPAVGENPRGSEELDAENNHKPSSASHKEPVPVSHGARLENDADILGPTYCTATARVQDGGSQEHSGNSASDPRLGGASIADDDGNTMFDWMRYRPLARMPFFQRRNAGTKKKDASSVTAASNNAPRAPRNSELPVEVSVPVLPSERVVSTEWQMVTRPRGQVTRAQLQSLLGELPAERLAKSSYTQPFSYKGIDEDLLCGGASDTGDTGHLQVIISGPEGFVLHAQRLLRELGVPEGALVLLP